MKRVILLFFCIILSFNLIKAQISVDKTKSHLISQKTGKPFFWLGDTAWELFHRLNREETIHYLKTRQKQGFNVVMAVALAEQDGIKQPNYYGDSPFNNLVSLEWDVTNGNDPKIADDYDYWDHIDFVVKEAAKRNIYIGLLPTWGDKVAHAGGYGPILFNNKEKAYSYASKLAKRYKNNWNIIWILGGDRSAVYERDGKKYDDRPVWRAMAKAIEDVYDKDVFITYHISWPETSTYFQNEEWLDMNSLQSSHGSRAVEPWVTIANDLKKKPQRPVMDMEPCYEDHPVNPWDNKWTRKDRGYFNDYDVRARIYRGVFAGGCGAVYGHHQIWQFLDTTRNAPIWVGDTIIGWEKALNAKAATQIHHLKDLMLSLKDFNRVEDNSLVVSALGSDYTDRIIATRNQKGTYALIYLPQPKEIKVDLDKLKVGNKRVSWFNPSTGKTKRIGRYSSGVRSFVPPSKTQKDWVLKIDLI